jgi:hypothetical protein
MRLHPKRKDRQGATLPKRWEPRFWELADARHKTVRLVRERVEALTEDANVDSEQKRLLVSRAAFLSLQLETLEVMASQGGEFDMGKWTQGVNALTGLLKALGLDKKAKVLDLKAHLAKKGKHDEDVHA